jgi:hypothetical protein
MEQLCEVRTRLLLEMSADLHNRMVEIWALREAIRSSEAAQRGYRQEPIHAAVVAPPAINELRV